MSSTAERIKERLGIVEVVGSYIKVDKAGANYKARCPFHNEKTPSFFISPGRASYYCFGCGAKGDIFTFVQEFEKVDFIGALKILAEKAGIELEKFQSEDKTESNRLRAVLEESTKFFESRLKELGTAKSSPKEYLLSRGLTEKTIEEWRIGFAKNEWRALSDFLKSKKISIEDMEKVGLVKKQEDGNEFYDRFRSRVMFPLIDPSGRVVGYSGRLFGVPDTEGPKYLNSPETPLFNKSEFLYGYNKAKDGIRQWGYAVLVEGQFDLIMCHQAGFTNAVATSGTALSTAHLEKLKRISDNLMIVYDADKAGIKATLRAWTSALRLGMDIKIAGLPAGEDPASLILQNKELFKEALKHSKHIIEYYLEALLLEFKEQAHDERKFWKTIAKEIIPLVAAIPSAIDGAHFISVISLKSGIPEDVLREELSIYKKSNVEGGNSLQTESKITPKDIAHIITPKENVLDRLVGIILMLESGVAADPHKKDVQKNIEAKVKEILHADTLMWQEFAKRLEEKPPELAFEAEVMHAGSASLEKDLEELYLELEERVLKEKFSSLMNELQRLEKAGEKDKEENKKKSFDLLKQCQDISLALSTLRKKKEKQGI